MKLAWIGALLTVLCAPVAIRYLAPERSTLGFELITVTGLLATSLLVCTVIAPSRLRSVTRTFGIETVLRTHRLLGTATAALVITHIGAVLVTDPRSIALLVPGLAQWGPAEAIAPRSLLVPLLIPPYRSLAGLVATCLLVAVVITAVSRGGRYEHWRSKHLVLAGLALLAAAVHVLLINHLVPTAELAGLLAGDPIGWPTFTAALTRNPAGALYFGLLAAIVLGVGVWRWMIRPMSRHQRYRVDRVTKLSDSAFSLTLRPVSRSHPGMAFRAGQFAWLRLTRDPFSQEHPFTVTSAVHSGYTVEFTIRQAGDWTDRLGRLREGDFCWLDGPHGALTPRAGSRGLVLIAGGVGIAPMLSILRTAARQGSQQSFLLILADRPGEGLHRDELVALTERLDLTVHDLDGAMLDVPVLEAILPGRAHVVEWLVCGSPLLVSGATAAIDGLGVPRTRVRTERFDI